MSQNGGPESLKGGKQAGSLGLMCRRGRECGEEWVWRVVFGETCVHLKRKVV